MSDENQPGKRVCEAGMKADGGSAGYCPRSAVETISVICIHEHIIEVALCLDHIDAVETNAQCPKCADKKLPADLKHTGCRLRVLSSVRSLLARAEAATCDCDPGAFSGHMRYCRLSDEYMVKLLRAAGSTP